MYITTRAYTPQTTVLCTCPPSQCLGHDHLCAWLQEGAQKQMAAGVPAQWWAHSLTCGAPLIGSALKKHWKPGWADSAAISSLRSSLGIQPCIRCRLSRNTQPPWAMHLQKQQK